MTLTLLIDRVVLIHRPPLTFLPCRCLPPIGSSSFGFSGPAFCEDAAVLAPGLPVRLFIPMTFRQFTEPHRHSVISCPFTRDTHTLGDEQFDSCPSVEDAQADTLPVC